MLAFRHGIASVASQELGNTLRTVGSGDEDGDVVETQEEMQSRRENNIKALMSGRYNTMVPA